MPITARYIAAQHIARRAGQLAHELFANRKALVDAERPADEYVGHAARAISAQIVSKLAAAFPADIFVDGEHPATSDAERLWTIEAIGGQRNFARAIPFYAISIAYAERGSCEAAVVYDPERGEMFHALLDQGAWCEHAGHEKRLEVATCKALEQAVLSVGLDERAPDPAGLPVRHELIDAGADARLFGAPSLELAQVAAGRLDGFVGLGIDPLGLMGALLLVEEAGGYVSHVPAAGGIRNDLPVVGCAPAISRALARINGAWTAEIAVEFPFEQDARSRGHTRERARATPLKRGAASAMLRWSYKRARQLPRQHGCWNLFASADILPRPQRREVSRRPRFRPWHAALRRLCAGLLQGHASLRGNGAHPPRLRASACGLRRRILDVAESYACLANAQHRRPGSRDHG